MVCFSPYWRSEPFSHFSRFVAGIELTVGDLDGVRWTDRPTQKAPRRGRRR
jgi:hypothetical protein